MSTSFTPIDLPPPEQDTPSPLDEIPPPPAPGEPGSAGSVDLAPPPPPPAPAVTELVARPAAREVVAPTVAPHRPRHTARWILLASAFVLVVGAVLAIALPARRDSQKYDDAHAAYVAGDCATAVTLFDELIDSWRLVDLTGRAGDAKTQRDECRRLLDIDTVAATDPTAALSGYLAFADAEAGPLHPIAINRAAALVDRVGVEQIAGLATCGKVPALVTAGVLTSDEATTLRTACIDVYDRAGLTAEAVDQAAAIVRAEPTTVAGMAATAYLTTSADGCVALAEIADTTGGVGTADRSTCYDVLDRAGRGTEAIALAAGIVDESPTSAAGRAAARFLARTAEGCSSLVPLGTSDGEALATCLDRFAAAGLDTDAYSLAVQILGSADGPGADRAAAFVVTSAEACGSTDTILDLPGIAARPSEIKVLLLTCIDRASGNPGVVAGLRLDYLRLLPADAGAAAQRDAFLASDAGCEFTDEVLGDRVLSADTGLVLELSFHCGQVAEYTGNWTEAIRLYQTFLYVAPGDARAATVQAGLARALIAQAEQSGAGELPDPTPVGGSGSGSAKVVIYNMSPRELRIVISGPESRIETIPACGDCEEYSIVGPLFCRTDVPSLTVNLASGDYKVMAEATAGGIDPFVGTWTLDGGQRYDSCFYILTTFG